MSELVLFWVEYARRVWRRRRRVSARWRWQVARGSTGFDRKSPGRRLMVGCQEKPGPDNGGPRRQAEGGCGGRCCWNTAGSEDGWWWEAWTDLRNRWKRQPVINEELFLFYFYYCVLLYWRISSSFYWLLLFFDLFFILSPSLCF